VHDQHQQQAPAIRVVLAEDGVLLREGLAGLLHRFGFPVIAMAGDAGGLHAAVAEHEPDLVITDIRMPPSFTDEGLRAAVDLRRTRRDWPWSCSASTCSTPTPPTCWTPAMAGASDTC
jgi:DNA-binding NarL/FixJ family response regulator